MSQRSESIMNLEDVKTRAENTFCSTFYKIGLKFEYFQYSLKDEIELRFSEDRVFEEREVWGVLCACIFAMTHLEKV